MMRAIRALRDSRSADGRGSVDREEGLTIIELVVAMSIFTIVLSMYFSALISMSHTTVRAQDGVDAADALRATFNTLDHQVRYATSINRPVQGSSGAWYVELEATNLPNAQPDMCYQWRLDPATNVMSTRTWSEDGTSSVTAWHGVSWDVTAPGGGSPFTFVAAEGSVLKQSLSVSLEVVSATAGTGQLAQQTTTFIARNSSSKSPSNIDADKDGVSDHAVCMTGMDQP